MYKHTNSDALFFPLNNVIDFRSVYSEWNLALHGITTRSDSDLSAAQII